MIGIVWRGLPRLMSLADCGAQLVSFAGSCDYVVQKGHLLRLNVSREPLFVFEFVETLFAFE